MTHQPPNPPAPKITATILLTLEDGEQITTTAKVLVLGDSETATRQAAETALDRANADVRAWLYRRTGPPGPRPTPPVDAPTAVLPRIGRP